MANEKSDPDLEHTLYGLGAILQQVQEDGKYHPIAYVSHALHGSEANYDSSKLEFLALKWAVTSSLRNT